jgi:hypothetical protein
MEPTIADKILAVMEPGITYNYNDLMRLTGLEYSQIGAGLQNATTSQRLFGRVQRVGTGLWKLTDKAPLAPKVAVASPKKRRAKRVIKSTTQRAPYTQTTNEWKHIADVNGKAILTNGDTVYVATPLSV